MQKIPVYMITGFLESGKTSFLQDIVTDEDFTEGQRCLLIVCEEGEVEYNNEDLCGNNITMITVDEEEKMNTDFLKYCKHLLPDKSDYLSPYPAVHLLPFWKQPVLRILPVSVP